MSPPEKRNGPGRPTGAAAQIAATITKHDQDDGTATGRQDEAVTVQARAFGPCPGRSLWAYLVRCGRCGGTHLHRGGPPRQAGYLRSAPCGAEYRVVARTVVPAVAAVAS